MRHQHISFIKSVIRIVGYALLPFNMSMAGVALVVSEVVGVLEEVGHE